jgi:NitT/TauT family transport system permease protein
MMKILFLFIGIVFYFIPLVANAIRTAPLEYIDVARGLGATEGQIMKKVYWPHALPQIFDGLIVVNGIGWTYVILAEIVNARDGLGYMINIAGRLQKSDEVFAGLLLIALVAIASDKFLHFIKKRYFFW